jgi:hypothetical protein
LIVIFFFNLRKGGGKMSGEIWIAGIIVIVTIFGMVVGWRAMRALELLASSVELLAATEEQQVRFTRSQSQSGKLPKPE